MFLKFKTMSRKISWQLIKIFVKDENMQKETIKFWERYVQSASEGVSEYLRAQRESRNKTIL